MFCGFPCSASVGRHRTNVESMHPTRAQESSRDAKALHPGRHGKECHDRLAVAGQDQEASASSGAAPPVRALAAGEAFMCLKASMMSMGSGKTMVEAFLLLMSLMVCR